MLGLHATWQASRKIQTVEVGDKWFGQSHGMSTWLDFNSMEVPPHTNTIVQHDLFKFLNSSRMRNMIIWVTCLYNNITEVVAPSSRYSLCKNKKGRGSTCMNVTCDGMGPWLYALLLSEMWVWSGMLNHVAIFSSVWSNLILWKKIVSLFLDSSESTRSSPCNGTIHVKEHV